ncbi:MAG: hypothetical protein CMJ18_00625 [Phycisphaeraceae bacterium]|nr:hypothetical protein [Phycisphaeraceae bacterium]
MAIERRKNGDVVFIYRPQGDVRRVFLAGDFNRWDPGDRRMIKSRDGSFRAKMTLEAGDHEYKFVVDGDWEHDATSDQQPNTFGTTNSVVRVQ